MEGQRPFLDSLPTIPSPLSLSIYPSLSSLPRPSFSQSTSFPSFIDFFAVVDSRYVILLRARDGKEGGREGGSRSAPLTQRRSRSSLALLTCFVRSLPSFFVRSRLQLKGKKGESKKCACVLSRPPTQNVAEFRGRMHTGQSVAPPPALMPPFLDRFQCLF